MKFLPNRYWIVLFFLSSSASFYACRPKVVDHQQMETYINKPGSGLKKTTEVKKVKVWVDFRPSDLLVEQDLKAKQEYTRQTVDSLRKIYAKNLYFVLHMSYRDQEILSSFVADKKKFTEMVEQLSFNMVSFVSLTAQKGDTLSMLDFAYPRAYGMSGSTDIMFVFENKVKSGVEKLTFNLEEFGLNTGKMQFVFNVTDITSVPPLKLPTQVRHISQHKK